MTYLDLVDLIAAATGLHGLSWMTEVTPGERERRGLDFSSAGSNGSGRASRPSEAGRGDRSTNVVAAPAADGHAVDGRPPAPVTEPEKVGAAVPPELRREMAMREIGFRPRRSPSP